MPTEITIAAVGDILLPHSMIQGSRIHQKDLFEFSPIFEQVAPILKKADLTIGNLEVPLAGRESRYTTKNKKSGFYTFNCPDELAPCLKNAGFDVLLTGNNHCMDRGFQGLTRTLSILDRHDIAHTGTYSTREQSNEFLIIELQGIRIGILSYSKSTNKIPVPAHQAWCVKLTDEAKMIEDLKALRPLVDMTIVCPHFGQEYRHSPIRIQRRIVHNLLKHGANLILGAHPHVIQPAFQIGKNQAGIYSLGNFLSTTLRNNPFTRNGVILQIKVVKDDSGKIQLSTPHYIPTWIRRVKSKQGQARSYEIIPIQEQVKISQTLNLSFAERASMHRAAEHTRAILNTKVAFP
ncbi:Capsule biosynthesis protein CapA [compost metagenome]